MTNLLDHPLLLSVGELSIYRQREDLVGRSLGCRESSCSIPQLAKARLEMKRNRVVDFGAYAGGLQMRAQPVALGRANDELVVDMRAVRRARGSVTVPSRPAFLNSASYRSAFRRRDAVQLLRCGSLTRRTAA